MVLTYGTPIPPYVCMLGLLSLLSAIPLLTIASWAFSSYH